MDPHRTPPGIDVSHVDDAAFGPGIASFNIGEPFLDLSGGQDRGHVYGFRGGERHSQRDGFEVLVHSGADNEESCDARSDRSERTHVLISLDST